MSELHLGKVVWRWSGDTGNYARLVDTDSVILDGVYSISALEALVALFKKETE